MFFFVTDYNFNVSQGSAETVFRWRRKIILWQILFKLTGASFIAIDLVYKNNIGVLFMFHTVQSLLEKFIILYYLNPLKCLLQEINYSSN